MNPIDIALRIATTAHAGQLDRDGYPVVLHTRNSSTTQQYTATHSAQHHE